jgi:hypothetical protein
VIRLSAAGQLPLLGFVSATPLTGLSTVIHTFP